MKRVINVLKIFLIFLIICACNNVYAASISLKQIEETFNNSSIVKQWASSGSGTSFTASSNSNSIIITAVMNNETTKIEYVLDGNILSVTLSQDNIVGAMATTYLIDSICQLHGYEDGESFITINSEEIMDYTLEEEGYKIEKLSDGNISIKIDITKKIPLLDVSDIYIKVSDLENMKEYIAGDGIAEKSKGNIWFNKNGSNGKYTLLVAEKENLTDNTYKSILSILEVMFDNDKVMEYFKKNYSNISNGDKEFKGFNIKVNPVDKTQDENELIPSDSGYKFVRIVIDKSLAISSAEGIENDSQEQVNNKTDIDTIPSAGKDINVFLIVLYIIIAICSVSLLIILLIKKIRK